MMIVTTCVNATDADGTSTLRTPSANPALVPTGGNNIGTFFASDNGGGPGGGIYFEIENVSANQVTINSWDINTDNATIVNVWTRSGTYSGFEQASSGWTLLGTDAAVVAQGTDLATPVVVGGLTINPGEVVGIAMEGDGPWNYTNGTGANEVHNNGTLELRLGSANNLAFAAGLFTPRVWNGVVYYSVINAAPPTPVPSLNAWGLMLLVMFFLVVGARYKFVK